MAGINFAKLYARAGDLYSFIPMRLGHGWAFPPLRLALVMTHRCNLRCSMCNVWRHAEANAGTREELTTGELLSLIRQSPGFSIVTFTGGEPFIREDLPELLAYACRQRRVHLVSNGTLINDSHLTLLANFSPNSAIDKGLLSFGISLEGPPAIHDQVVAVPGSFAKTMSIIERMVRLKRGKFPIIDVKVVMSLETFPHLLDLYDAAAAVGADLVSFQIENTQISAYGVEMGGPHAHLQTPPPVAAVDPAVVETVMTSLLTRQTKKTPIRFNPDISLEDMQNRYRNIFRAERFYCDTPWTVMHVGPYGDVFPCYSYPMGNVRTQSLAAIWNGPAYRQFRTMVKRARIFPGCAGCCVMKARDPK